MKHAIYYVVLAILLAALFLWVWVANFRNRTNRQYTVQAKQMWEVWIEAPGSKPECLGSVATEEEGWERGRKRLCELSLSENNPTMAQVHLNPVFKRADDDSEEG